MVLLPLKYGDTTILLFYFSSSRKLLKEYLYIVKIILNSDGTLLFQKGTMILKVLFILTGHILLKGICSYDLS